MWVKNFGGCMLKINFVYTKGFFLLLLYNNNISYIYHKSCNEKSISLFKLCMLTYNIYVCVYINVCLF